MRQKNFWLRTLNIRPDESWLVKKLFLLQFLQGAGIAFFFTAAFALFLARFQITELPYVFVYSSLLLWMIGFIYSRIEHKFDISKLAIIITVFMAVSMLVFRLAFVFIKDDWFLYWMLAWFNVLYLLNNLEFWGIASLLFDTRQSKRLFGVISAGDIPAKFIGYTLALFTVEYIGTINLLWIGVGCMLASIPFLVIIKKSGKLLEPHHKQVHHHPVKHTAHVGKIVQNFAGNTLIRRLSLLGIIITGCYIITNFAFYAGVKEAFHDDISLAKFVAFFLAFVRIIAMVVKMIFTGRLINRLGIILSLLITPVVMLFFLVAIILTQDMTGFQKIIIYLFGATSIVVDVLRSAITTPVFLTLMQPLSHHERLRAHTIVKGIMDPFASLITGILLLILIHYEVHHKVNLLTLTYVLLVIGVCWIVGIYRINSQYLKMIIKTISSRYFNREDFSINDSGTLEWLKEKAAVGSEPEVINILNMLYRSNTKMSEDLVVTALQHPSENVRMAALKLVQQKKFPSAGEFLLPLLQAPNSPEVIAESIGILCTMEVDNSIILPFLKHHEPKIRQAALMGLFYHGKAASKEKAIAILQHMVSSKDRFERFRASEILGSQRHQENIGMIRQLINDGDSAIRKNGFLAAGKSGDKILLQEMIDRIGSEPADVLLGLLTAGEPALPLIREYLDNPGATLFQKERLILLCGTIGGPAAHKLLKDLLNRQPDEYTHVIKALYRSNYIPSPAEQPVFISLIKKLLARSASIIYMQNSLEPLQKNYQLLNNSFGLELKAVRDSLLYVFALLYDRENIGKVRSAYAAGKKESIINAMEIIDITVRKDLAYHFNTIFEPGNIAERLRGLRNIYPVEFFENVERVLVRILAEEARPFSNWTMACCLYTSKKQQHDIDRSLVEKYTVAENILVRETAFYAL